MTTIAARTDGFGNVKAYYDGASSETIAQFNPCVLFDDFIGPGNVVPVAGLPVPGYPWVAKTVLTLGVPTVAPVANFSGGAVAIGLDDTGEAQEATLYANDELNWDVTKGLVFEARVALSVIPTDVCAGVFGLHSAW